MTAAGVLGLAAGLLADLTVGDPQRAHPVAAYGALALRLEDVDYRSSRTAGAAHVVVLVGAPTLATAVLQRRCGPPGRTLLLALVAWTALGGRSLWREAEACAAAVADGDLDGARRRLPALVGRDPSHLDGPELCRAVVESVAENTADAITGPLVFGALAGPAGVVAHRCTNTLDAMIGHRSDRYLRYGWGAARLDDVLGWLPARVSALLAAGCAPVLSGDLGGARRSLATWRRDAGKHPSPNAGPCEAAFAGALGVRLGGANRYGERVEVRGPLGDGPAPTPATVRGAIRLSQLISGATLVLCAVLAAVSGRDRAPAWARP